MPKLKPRQMIGLAMIVVFGAGAIWRANQPSEREIMEQRLASLPRLNDTITIPDLPPVDLYALTPSAIPSTTPTTPRNEPIWKLSGIDYYALGSQPARDDLYCAGVLRAEFEAIKAEAHPDRMSMLIRDSQALEAAGIAKLTAEGHATNESSAGFILAWGDKAAEDYAAGAPRISAADCTTRSTPLQ